MMTPGLFPLIDGLSSLLRNCCVRGLTLAFIVRDHKCFLEARDNGTLVQEYKVPAVSLARTPGGLLGHSTWWAG